MRTPIRTVRKAMHMRTSMMHTICMPMPQGRMLLNRMTMRITTSL